MKNYLINDEINWNVILDSYRTIEMKDCSIKTKSRFFEFIKIFRKVFRLRKAMSEYITDKILFAQSQKDLAEINEMLKYWTNLNPSTVAVV